MKFNKWTLGLAAVGIVSLSSAVQAEETSQSVLTAVSSTTLSGYVDTSMQWNFGTGNENNPPYSFGSGKADGFNLNVVQLTLEKPLNESEWSSGYHADIWVGPDASALGTDSIYGSESSNIAIRQAYVALRMPVGNGLDWKIGVFDTVIGYESVASPNNPNYTRSYGQAIEPQTHTGVLASYRINDTVSLSAGIANTVGPRNNERGFGRDTTVGERNIAESYKTYMGSIALTAPENWGFLSGSTMYAGIVNGFNTGRSDRSARSGFTQTSYYVGTTLATPVAGLRMGAAFDYEDVHGRFSEDNGVATAIALYASYQATEKLSFHLRGEYLDDQAGFFYDATDNIVDGTGRLVGTGYKVWAATATAQYDLWKNVISRLEFRWDHSDSRRLFGATSSGTSLVAGGPTRRNAFMLAANVIYKF